MNKSLYIKTVPFQHKENETEKELPIGLSRWLGDPDLPKGFPYPTYIDPDTDEETEMTFICQINLADLPKSCNALPHKGLLLFFAEISYYEDYCYEPAIQSHPSETDAVKVLYFPDNEGFETQILIDDDDLPITPESREIHFMEDPLPLGEAENQLLGSSGHLEWEDWPEPCEGWQLLLQMDSCEEPDYNVMFMDCGVLCLIIDPKDLKKLDFSKVRGIILST